MASLIISLEDGFAHDHVVVSVGNVVVLNDKQVSTRYQISLAREIDTDVPAGTCRVRVQLPDRGLDSTLDVDTDRTRSVRVSVDGDRLDLRPAGAPRHA